MEGDWQKLRKDYADTPNVVIGACDCTSNCKAKCGDHGVKGFPTLKLKVDGRIEEYNGAREYSSFKREVESKLNPRPACSLDSKDACKPADLAILEESEKMSKSERAAKIKEVEQEVKDAKKQIKDLEKKVVTLTESLDLIKAGGQTVEKVEQLLKMRIGVRTVNLALASLLSCHTSLMTKLQVEMRSCSRFTRS